MRKVLQVIYLLMVVAGGSSLWAADDHGEHKVAGPNGGKIYTLVETKFEFFITTARKVQITFLDKANSLMPATDQSVSIVCGDRMKPTTLNFVIQSNGTLLSEQTLPEGNQIPAIIKFSPKAGVNAKPERLLINLSDCGGCHLKEYACICDH